MPDFWQRLAAAPPDEPLPLATDPDGIPVFLGRNEWRHILDRHPEMFAFRDLIMRAVSSPVTREPDKENPNARRHYLNLPANRNISARSLPLRVRVVIKYVNEQDGLKGYISTAFLTR